MKISTSFLLLCLGELPFITTCHRGRFLCLRQRQFRHSVPGGGRPTQNDVDRSAYATHRPPWTGGGSRTFSGLHRRVQRYLGLQPRSDCEALDFPAPKATTEQRSICTSLDVSEEHWSKLKVYCRKNRITQAIYFKTLYALLINQYCRAESDFAITEFSSGRDLQLYVITVLQTEAKNYRM